MTQQAQKAQAGRPVGLVLFSTMSTVRARLEKVFRPSGGSRDVFVADGTDYRTRIDDLLDPLARSERESLRAAPLFEGGRYDAWTAQPIDLMLARLASAWFPRVLRDDALGFDFQPVVDAQTLQVHGHEALARTSSEHAGHDRSALLTAAKAHDSLLEYDQCVRRLAIIDGYPCLEVPERLFVSMLPMTVYDLQYCLETVLEAALMVGADLGRVVFEVVEADAPLDLDHLRIILDAYRKHGACVGLRDLGRGNSTLSSLSRLTPEYLRLDRELLTGAISDREPAMIHGIVRHAQRFGTQVIADGIETSAELRFARGLGVDFVQGSLIATPQADPVREFGPTRMAA